MTCATKICGLSTPESVACARDNGASHLGFIFFPKSPRNVSPSDAAALTQGLSDIEIVAVTVDADENFLDEIVTTLRPTALQLHGGETVSQVADIKQKYGLPVIKALSIREQADLSKVSQYDGAVDLLLLDAKPPKGSQLPGGNGVSFDWSILDELKTSSPVLLSGGIDLENIDDALAHVQNPKSSIIGIDVSSGVESAPGVKDTAKIEALLKACRKTC